MVMGQPVLPTQVVDCLTLDVHNLICLVNFTTHRKLDHDPQFGNHCFREDPCKRRKGDGLLHLQER